MLRHLRRCIAALLTVLVTTTLLQGLVLAEPKAISESDAATLLSAFHIVRGDPSGDMRLGDRLTRAQAAALFVRLLGRGEFSSALSGSVPYTDAYGHWAAGDIAMAERLGLMRGVGNGQFRPDSDITYAEVLTVLLRVLEREPQGSWSPETIRVSAAQVGLVPQGVLMTEPAVRGKVFWSMAVAARSLLPTGQTVLQKYVDNVPPELTMDQTHATTTDETTIIAGNASGATEVAINGTAVTLDSSGRFRQSVRLSVGPNALKVEASDLAGNRVVRDISIERQVAYARIEATGPNLLAAGTSVKLDLMGYDNKGSAVALNGLKATVSGGLATFSTQTGVLTAGNQAGQGVLTLSIGSVSKAFPFTVVKPSEKAVALRISPINAGETVLVGREYPLTVRVLDGTGTPLSDDYGRTVTLTQAGPGGVALPEPTAKTEAGVATFKVVGSQPGDLTLTASSSGLSAGYAPVHVVTPVRVVLASTGNQLSADGLSSTAIRATLQNEAGRPVPNTTGQDIRMTLTSAGAMGQITDPYLTIRSGASTSVGDDGLFRAGVQAGAVSLGGVVSSGQVLSVMPASITITSQVAGVRLQVVVPATSQKPIQDTAQVTVRVLNAQGQLESRGSYAFQLQVSTSNGDAVTRGIPEGVQLSFRNSSYVPVDDGLASSDPLNSEYSVIGRTHQGIATLDLRYAKSGVVTLTPVLLGGSEAYHPTDGFGAATASAAMTTAPAKVTFAGTASKIQLSVDSALGQDLPYGATGPVPTSVTVRARVMDENGTAIPGQTGSIKLTRTSAGNRVTRFPSTNAEAVTKSLVSNVAEWAIQTSATPGFDVYEATAPGLGSATITVAVRSTPASRPTIMAIRGSDDGNPSPSLGLVGPEDDYMDIQIDRQVPINRESTYWVTAKVFRKGESNPLFTGPVDISQEPPIIRVPKANLAVGTHEYEVRLHNGYRETDRSVDPGYGLGTVSVVRYEPSFRLTAGYFDTANDQLVLSTSGLADNGMLDIQKLSVVRGTNRINLLSLNASVTSTLSPMVVLRAPGLTSALSAELFEGTLQIVAEPGWYTDAQRSRVAPASDRIILKPSATISHATLDDTSGMLYLYGEGLSQGSLNLNAIQVGPVSLRYGSGSSDSSITSTTDTQIAIRLSQSTLTAIRALPEGTVHVAASSGWLSVSATGRTFRAPGVSAKPLYVRAIVTGATYDPTRNSLTIRGAGFADSELAPEKLSFRAIGSSAVRTLGSPVAVTMDPQTLAIQLNDVDAAHFESSGGFAGKTVFLNTLQGWLIDSRGRQAVATPTDSVLFAVPSP